MCLHIYLLLRLFISADILCYETITAAVSAELFEASALIIVTFLYYQVLGTDGLNAYLNKYRIELDPQLEALVGRYSIPIYRGSPGL